MGHSFRHFCAMGPSAWPRHYYYYYDGRPSHSVLCCCTVSGHLGWLLGFSKSFCHSRSLGMTRTTVILHLFTRNAKNIFDYCYHRSRYDFVNIMETTISSYVKLYQHLVNYSLYISAISGWQQIASRMCWPLKVNNATLLSGTVHTKCRVLGICSLCSSRHTSKCVWQSQSLMPRLPAEFCNSVFF